ncbi:MAG: TonB-dependent receptor [Bryobacteraceae bacterium]
MLKHWIVGLVAIALGPFLAAQNANGILDGRITDLSGAAVPGAKVAVENQGTGTTQQFTSNSEGRFYDGQVLIGVYRVTVERTGFQKYQQSNIRVDVAQTVSLDISLKLGDVSTLVEVNAQAAQLTTESSSVSTVIGSKAILDLPSSSRNPFALATLAPGVVPGGGTTPWISGGRNASSEITVDGTSVIVPENNVSINDLGYTPIQDSVEEFSIITNSLAPEYGRTGGGVINVATRSGQNALHISAYEFLKNSKLNTNTWANNRNGAKLAALEQNQFGGTAGGPVWIPGLYDGRNKTFFFFSEQVTYAGSGTSPSTTVPIAAWEKGDFSQLKNGNGQAITIFDPMNLDAKGQRLPFAGNIIPMNRQDKVAVGLLKYFPAPNATPTNAFTYANDFFVQGKVPSNDIHFDSRIDHYFSTKLRMFVRGSYENGLNLDFNGFGNAASSLGSGPSGTINTNVAANFIYTLNPTTIVNVNLGYQRKDNFHTPFSQGLAPSALGLPKELDGVVDNFEFPQITINGLGSGSQVLGQSSYTSLKFIPYTYTAHGDVTKVFSRHTVKAGYEFRKLFMNFRQLGSPDGQYSFQPGFTQQVINSAASPTQGFGMAAFLLGMPSNNGGDLNFTFATAASSDYDGLYIQDDWKLTPKLTMNIGMRWDVDIPRTERYNRLSYWDPTAPSPLEGLVPAGACANCGNLKGAMMFVGTANAKYGRHQTPTDLHDFGPRIGFAYHFLPKTVFRAGYGVMYSGSVLQAAGTSGSSGTEGFQSSTGFNATFDNGATFASQFPFDNPFPTGYNRPQGNKPGPFSGTLTDVGNGIGDSYFSDYVNPVIQQWNGTLQQEFVGWIFEAGYLGSKGNHLIDGESNLITYNQLPASFFALGNQLNQSVANPFYGIITTPGSSLAQPTVQYKQLLTAYPQYTAANAFHKPGANSNYQSFTLSANKRFSKGLQAQISFTGGKLLDDSSQTVTFLGAAGNKQDYYCRKCEKSISAQDVSRRLVGNFNYELPAGHGKKFLTAAPKPVDFVLGGWQMNGIVTFSKGLPLAISNGGNNSQINSNGQRPNNNGQSGEKSGPIADRLNAYFDPSVFSQAGNFTFGDTSRFSPNLRAPGIHNLDFSMFKSFKYREKLTTQFRAEAYNLTNSPTWNAPNTTVTSVGQFGTVTSANGQRTLQLALKLLF